MPNRQRKNHLNSSGHRLIVELQLYLTDGSPMLRESRDTWRAALWELFIAQNKQDGVDKFLAQIGLEYVVGKKEDKKVEEKGGERAKEIRGLINDLRKDVKDGFITKKFFQQQVAILSKKLEKGGLI